MVIISSSWLKDFTKQVFEGMGCPASQAEVAAECLNQADLRGVDFKA